MKPKKQSEKNIGKPEPARASGQKDSTSPSSELGSKKISGKKVWLFRFLALSLPLIFLLLGIELVLRLVGYGYPTTFFVPQEINGVRFLVDNPHFAERFFPKSMARTPSPVRMTAVKSPGTIRIFIFGESAALGDPEPAFGFGRYLEVLLQNRFPTNRFEVIVAAITAINSHALLPMAEECAKYEGDLWILYIGNNEVVGPFGAGTVLGPRTPPLWVISTALALKRTRTGQLLDALLDKATSSSTRKSWGGMQMFLNARTRPEEPSRRRTLSYFSKNLEDILAVARKSGIKVLLSTVATNLKDCPPFASLHPRSFSTDQQNAWDGFYQAGVNFEAASQFNEAIEQYRKAAQLDSTYADLQYRLGRAYLAQTNLAQARQNLESARDEDALSFRADSEINSNIIALSQNKLGQGGALLDAMQKLSASSPEGMTGKELFYEHVHLNFAGNYQLALAAAESASSLLSERARAAQPNWAPEAECEELLCATLWDKYRVYDDVLQREGQPPFTMQLDHSNRVTNLREYLRGLRRQMTRDAAASAVTNYVSAVARRPDDFYLRANFAKLSEDLGNYPQAVEQWRKVQALLPYHFGPAFYLGKALAHTAANAEAEKWLRAALKLRPDLVDAMDELAQVLTREKRGDEATQWFEKALALQPQNPKLNLHFAQSRMAFQDHGRAVSHLRNAIAAKPDYWEARYYLAMELAATGNLPEAEQQLREVIRLRPDYVMAHINLGVLLSKTNRLPQAIAEFNQALKLDPNNQTARNYLQSLGASAAPAP